MYIQTKKMHAFAVKQHLSHPTLFFGTCYRSINFFYKMWPKDCPLWYTLQTISFSAEIYKYNNQKNILFQWRYQSNKKLQKYHFLSPKLRLHIFDDFIGSKILNLYCPEIFMEIYLIFINLFYFFQKQHFFILQHLGTSI